MYADRGDLRRPETDPRAWRDALRLDRSRDAGTALPADLDRASGGCLELGANRDTGGLPGVHAPEDAEAPNARPRGPRVPHEAPHQRALERLRLRRLAVPFSSVD